MARGPRRGERSLQRNRRQNNQGRLRRFFSIEQKLEIVEYARNTSKKQASRRFGVQPKQIRCWSHDESEMMAIPRNQRASQHTLHRGASPAFEDIERLLAEWHREMVSMHNIGVTIHNLMNKAIELQPSLRRLNTNALRSRIVRFMARNNLVLRRVNSFQHSPLDQLQPRIDAFVQSVRLTMDSKRFSLSHVWNMDQTAVFFDMPPLYTVVQKGIKSNKILTTNSEKNRVSVLLLARGDGLKAIPLIVYKGASRGRINREIREYDDTRANHTTQKNAWTDLSVLRYWCNQIWRPIVDGTREGKFLLVDSLRLHRSNQTLLRCNNQRVHIGYVPEHCSSILQPLDLGVMKLFKQRLRDLWSGHILHNRNVTRRNVSDWVKEAWDRIPPESISRSFSLYIDIANRMELE